MPCEPSSSLGLGGVGPLASTCSRLSGPHGCRTSSSCARPISTLVSPAAPSMPRYSAIRGPVLVTGAAGFAGSHLLERLSGHHELVAWSRSPTPPDVTHLARWQLLDLLDRDGVRAAIRDVRPSAVYHLAGVSHVAESFSDPS